LQKAFDLAFKEEKIENTRPQSILILGFGCGSVAQSLQSNYFHDCNITGVEIDDEIVKLYNNHYPPMNNLELHCDEAASFVQSCTSSYDLIVVDLYQELEVPSQFHSSIFIKQLKQLLNDEGGIYFNQVVNNVASQNVFQDLMLTFSSSFKNVRSHHVMDINRIIVAN
jgi:spermidine synthase